jgi:hypothetical protein
MKITYAMLVIMVALSAACSGGGAKSTATATAGQENPTGSGAGTGGATAAYDIAIADVEATGDESGMNFHVTLDNRGKEIRDLDWQIRSDGDIVAAGTVATHGLATGASAEFDQFIESAPGSHVFVIELDPTDVFKESNTADDLRTLVLEVGPRPPVPADGAVDLIIRDPHFHREIDSRRIDFELTAINNTASDTAADNIHWIIRMDGSEISSGTIASIAAGAASKITATYIAPRDDLYHLYTCDIDTENLVPEADESNNSWSFSIKVPPQIPPVTNTADANLVLIAPEMHGPAWNEPRLTFHFKVGNASPQGLPVEHARWRLVREGVEVAAGELAVIDAGTQQEVFTWCDENGPGEPEYVIEIDPDATIPEASESDNSVQLRAWLSDVAGG